MKKEEAMPWAMAAMKLLDGMTATHGIQLLPMVRIYAFNIFLGLLVKGDEEEFGEIDRMLREALDGSD